MCQKFCPQVLALLPTECRTVCILSFCGGSLSSHQNDAIYIKDHYGSQRNSWQMWDSIYYYHMAKQANGKHGENQSWEKCLTFLRWVCQLMTTWGSAFYQVTMGTLEPWCCRFEKTDKETATHIWTDIVGLHTLEDFSPSGYWHVSGTCPVIPVSSLSSSWHLYQGAEIMK